MWQQAGTCRRRRRCRRSWSLNARLLHLRSSWRVKYFFHRSRCCSRSCSFFFFLPLPPPASGSTQVLPFNFIAPCFSRFRSHEQHDALPRQGSTTKNPIADPTPTRSAFYGRPQRPTRYATVHQARSKVPQAFTQPPASRDSCDKHSSGPSAVAAKWSVKEKAPPNVYSTRDGACRLRRLYQTPPSAKPRPLLLLVRATVSHTSRCHGWRGERRHGRWE